MYRYLLLIWHESERSAAHAALTLARRIQASLSNWAIVLNRPGLLLVHAGLRTGSSETLLLHDEAGAILGKIFRSDLQSDESVAASKFDEQESSRVVTTGARHLLTHYWGQYIAVVQHRIAQKTSVLRGPSSALPCFFTLFEGVRIFFSDVEDTLGLGLSFSINWSYIGAVALYSALQVRETGLTEITEVQPGECVDITPEGTSNTLSWDPFAIARSNLIEDPEKAIADLRRTVRSCVHAWASCHESIVHTVSGGLDSSIVLSCLRDAPTHPAVVCVNYFSHHPSEDERRYARLATRQARVELIECRREVATVNLAAMLRMARSVKPLAFMYELEHARFESQLAHERHATAICSGTGGDAVFAHSGYKCATADFLWDHGASAGLWGVVLDATCISKKSVWATIGPAVKMQFRHRSRKPQPAIHRNTRFAHPSVVASIADNGRWRSPWNARPNDLPEGKLRHIEELSITPAFYGLLEGARNVERLHPLLSQPIVELCFRIPSYLWIKGGWDRSMARSAFSQDVPVEIIRRQWKGGVDHHTRNILSTNQGLIRELLLDGLLVKADILDREKLDTCLSRHVASAEFQHDNFLAEHLCTEAWVRSWHRCERRLSA